MTQYKVTSAVVVKGDKKRRGAIVELSDAEAARFGADLAPLDAAPVAAPAEPESVPVAKLGKDALVAACEANGLSSEGTKAALVERLTLAGITHATNPETNA